MQTLAIFRFQTLEIGCLGVLFGRRRNRCLPDETQMGVGFRASGPRSSRNLCANFWTAALFPRSSRSTSPNVMLERWTDETTLRHLRSL